MTKRETVVKKHRIRAAGQTVVATEHADGTFTLAAAQAHRYLDLTKAAQRRLARLLLSTLEADDA